MGSVVKPLVTFEKTLNRAICLIEAAKQAHPSPLADDLARSSVVLAIAGFDRYFTAKFCDVLIDHLKSGKEVSDSTAKVLREAGLDTKFALKLAVSKKPFRKIRTIVQSHLSDQTTQRTSAIDSFFLNIGLKDLCRNAQAKAKRKTVISRTMKLVDLRNEIAHEGHVQRNGEPRKIDIGDIENRIKDMRVLVERCDEIIENAFGKKAPVSA
jgi:hypothetical protein